MTAASSFCFLGTVISRVIFWGQPSGRRNEHPNSSPVPPGIASSQPRQTDIRGGESSQYTGAFRDRLLQRQANLIHAGVIPPSKSTNVLPPHRQLRISSRVTIWRGRSASSCSTRNGCGWIFSEIPALRSSPLAPSSWNWPEAEHRWRMGWRSHQRVPRGERIVLLVHGTDEMNLADAG